MTKFWRCRCSRLRHSVKHVCAWFNSSCNSATLRMARRNVVESSFWNVEIRSPKTTEHKRWASQSWAFIRLTWLLLIVVVVVVAGFRFGTNSLGIARAEMSSPSSSELPSPPASKADFGLLLEGEGDPREEAIALRLVLNDALLILDDDDGDCAWFFCFSIEMDATGGGMLVLLLSSEAFLIKAELLPPPAAGGAFMCMMMDGVS